MKNKAVRSVGIGLLTTGIAIIIIAVFLLVKLDNDEKHADEASKRVMDVLRLAAEKTKQTPMDHGESVLLARDKASGGGDAESTEAAETEESAENGHEAGHEAGQETTEAAEGAEEFEGTDDEAADQEEELMIDGIGYLGYLSFPEFGRDLPVIADWDYEKLKEAPVRYDGTFEENNIVIAGHAYKSHFRFFEDEKPGFRVIFTDPFGNETVYRIVEKEVLQPTEIERMKIGDWDMTLFTCTYSGKARLALRCSRM